MNNKAEALENRRSKLKKFLDDGFRGRLSLMEKEKAELESRLKILDSNVKLMVDSHDRSLRNLGRANEQDLSSYEYLFFGSPK